MIRAKLNMALVLALLLSGVALPMHMHFFHGHGVQVHGAWAASTGYTDNPAEASADEGNALLEVVVQRVSDFLVAFDQTS